MEEVIRFALLGFGVGALYALASQGLIIIYRGSGVLNFALGAIGMAGAYVWWELTANQEWGFLPALVVGVAFSAAIGALTHLLLMRPLRYSAPLVRVIATLGVLITLQSIAVLRYESTPKFVQSDLPTDVWNISGEIVISADRVILLGIAAALTLALWLLYRYTRFGLATSAVAESERSASSTRPVARPHRDAELDARLRPRRTRRDPDRPDRDAAAGGPHEPRARRDRGRPGGRLPLVPDRVRRRASASASPRPR